jgi:5-methylcytosine-specific restriction endonuclease McrA
MLTLLRNEKLITSTKVREVDWQNEVTHRGEFARFLAEIPQDFKTIARLREKKDLVRNHLKTFYKFSPKDEEVDTVLERITNLAFYIEKGKEAVENKASQHQFKRDQWQVHQRCALCGFGFTSIQDATLDHIVPLSLGGAERSANWQLTCALCNIQKQEYWGISDLSRLASLRGCQGNFFRLTEQDIIGQLRAKANPTRYWVLERDNRMCSTCEVSAKVEKLHIARREKDFLLTIDNLTIYCFDCVKKTKLHYSE